MPLGNTLSWTTRIDNKKLQGDAKRTQSIVGGMASKVSSFINPAVLGAAAAAAAAVAFKKIVEVNIVFEKSLSSLQSILGTTNEEMVFFKTESIRLGSTTTQTATQVAEAFKLIGSQKPELLKSQEALLDVTEQAIILSEAAEIDVPTAARALTGSLNQMGASALQASDFVNILAAGSKVGAADIPYLNSAIEKSGAVARDANLSMEQLVGALETIAPSISEPSTAGLQFKNVLLELQKAGYGFSSGQFDLQEALGEVNGELDAISDPAKRAAKEMEVFGKISLVAGKALLNQTDQYVAYTEAVTGTNTALEQQSINTNNLQGSIDMLKSALEGAMLGLNDEGGLTGGLKAVVDILIKVVQNFDIFADLIDYMVKPFGELVQTLFDLGKTLGLVSDEGDAVAGIMKIFTTVTKIWYSPLILVVKTLALLVKAFTFVVQKIKDFVSGNKEMQKGMELVRKVLDFVKEKFMQLVAPLKLFINNIKTVGVAILKSKIAEATKKISEALNWFISRTRELIQMFVEFIKTNKVTATTLALLRMHFDNIRKIINALISPIKDVINKFNEFSDSYRKEQEPSAINAIRDSIAGVGNALDTAQEKAQRFFDFIGMESNPFADKMDELKKQQLELNKLQASRMQVDDDVAPTEDASSVISAKDIEKLKIDAMVDGIEKRKKLVEFETRARIQIYKDAGIYTTEISEQIENDKNTAIEEIQNTFLEEQAQKILELENLKISFMMAGINKRLDEIDFEYAEKLRLLDKSNLSEQEKIDAQTAILAEKQLAIDEANRTHQQGILDEEKTVFDQEIALRESEVNLIEISEKRKREIEIENQILRLQSARDFSLDLTDIQKKTIDNQILEQQRLLYETKNSNQFLEDSYKALGSSMESFGNKFIKIQSDTTKSQEEKSKAIKSALLSEVQTVVVASIIKYVASVLGSTGPAGLILAPLAGLAATAMFATLKSTLGYEKGGFLGGDSKTGDKTLFRGNKGELIANQTQKDKILWYMLNSNVPTKKDNQEFQKMTKLLSENNEILRKQKSAIIHNDTVLETQNGVLTGSKTHL